VTWVYFVLPFVAFLLPIFIQAVWSAVKVMCNSSAAGIMGVSPTRFVRNGALVLLYTWWPTVSRRCFEALTCSDPIDGHRYLEADYRQKCRPSGGPDTGYAVMAKFWLATFVPTFPLACLWILFKNRDRLEEERVQERYIFLYQGFRPGMPYWETLVMVRKLAFAVVIAAFKHDPLQPYVGIWVLMASLTVHVVYRPYRFRGKQLLETVVLAVLMASLVLGWSSELRDAEGNLVYQVMRAGSLTLYGYFFSAFYVLLHSMVVVIFLFVMWVDAKYDPVVFAFRFSDYPRLVSCVHNMAGWMKEDGALLITDGDAWPSLLVDGRESGLVVSWSLFSSPLRLSETGPKAQQRKGAQPLPTRGSFEAENPMHPGKQQQGSLDTHRSFRVENPLQPLHRVPSAAGTGAVPGDGERGGGQSAAARPSSLVEHDADEERKGIERGSGEWM